MDVACQVTNIGFYFSGQAVYSTVEVLEKKIVDSNNKFVDYFRSVKKGHKLNLKSTEDDYRKLVDILFERVVKIRVEVVEQPKDPKQGLKYIIQSAALCGLLQVIGL